MKVYPLEDPVDSDRDLESAGVVSVPESTDPELGVDRAKA